QPRVLRGRRGVPGRLPGRARGARRRRSEGLVDHGAERSRFATRPEGCVRSAPLNGGGSRTYQQRRLGPFLLIPPLRLTGLYLTVLLRVTAAEPRGCPARALARTTPPALPSAPARARTRRRTARCCRACR